ncbi:LysR family transcriptional regulator [Paraburkholderia caffeinilytica]|uniref:LysR family transcriptional regulator n=1 Tax=Paraburkholderia caffeinilytica TaxID=1761016 RepID=A0ABQ1MXH8_9BURK|nr:LysR family transcriptional regulator [Paraburkholderia caffeinilytica]GGC48917.1 LysR family transcriptional regulator [Paraburkholderia caffeinilytica]CAB3782256.1 HTH-type transcriptional regulator DmlR [Paraburkholderia caffeinilytica]
MDLSQRVRAILSFVQAADAGSFAAAGRVLGITSAAVSKNVASLEKALGVRLMNRTTRTLNLTEEGGAFLRQARVALDALDSAIDTVAAQRVVPSGRVRISTSWAFGREQLMPVLPALLSRYPSLSVAVDFDDRVVDLVRDGYDIGIRGGNIPDSALVSRLVFRLNLVLVASPEYLVHHGVPQTPRELRAHRVIARRFLGGQVAPWSFKMEDGSTTTFDPADAAVLTLSAPESVVQAACDSVGIAQVGVHLAWKHLCSGALKVVLRRYHEPGNYEMVMQYPHRALMAPRVRATLDHLLESFAKDKDLHVPLEALDAYVA